MIAGKRKGYNWHIADFVILVVTSLLLARLAKGRINSEERI
jgi:hypothetical protein